MPEQHTTRPEILNTVTDTGFGVVEKPLTAWERLSNHGLFRKSIVLICLAIIWQAYAVWQNNPLLFPTFSDTLTAFFAGVWSGNLIAATWSPRCSRRTR